MAKLSNPVLLAVIGAAHGIKGELRVRSFTADPLALGDYGALADGEGRSFEIAAIRPQGEGVVVRFAGVADRTAAERLAGTELLVDRASLPEAEEGEFYHADLVGLGVRDETGSEIGKVTAVHDFGGGDLLELTVDGRRGVLIPFSAAAVPQVSLTHGFVSVDRVASGLVDPAEEEQAEGPVDEPDGATQTSAGNRPRRS